MTLPFRRTLADREEVLGGVMLAPALAYVILLVGVPFVFAIALGFSNATAGSLSFGWAGLQNYTAILADPIFLRALRNSVVVTVGSQVLVVVLATAAAQVFRATFRGKRFARFVLLLPWAVPVSLAAIAWAWIFDSTFSVINWTLKAAGLLHGWLYWLGDPALALLAIIIVQAWRIFPFATVIVLAGLSSIPQEIVEAAIVDGAGFWRRLFRVELPLLLPVVAVAVLFGVVYAAALGFVVFAGFPFYWMLVTSFKQNRDLYVGASDLSHIPWIFNDAPTLEHVKLLLGQTDFPRWVLNTLVVVVAVVVITVAVAVPAGYSLARLVGRWGERMGMGIFFTYLIPPTLLFVPFSRLISLLGLQDSLGALILIYPTMTIPFCTWLVMGFLRSVPWEIEEQAMIDGYSRLAVILKVAPRLIVPGILTVVVFTFTLVMQEFVYALTFISSVEKMTVSLGVPIALVRGDVYHWGALMAAALFTSIPLAVVYNLFIDRFIQGFTMGAVKG